MVQALYEGLWRAGTPLVRWVVRSRAARGKEDLERIDERFGRASLDRPEGPLIWLHASSVGEAVAGRALALGFREAGFEGTLLLTTFTVSAGRGLQGDSDFIHQYLPYDHPGWVQRFLDSWRPDLAVMLVNEVWPTLASRVHKAGVPLALASAGLSDESLRFWASVAPIGVKPLRCFDLVLAADPEHADTLRPHVRCLIQVMGDLKAAALPPDEDADLVQQIREAAGDRTVLLAASTHPGEDAPLLDLAADRDDVFCVLAPRHPRRADEVVALAGARGLAVVRRTAEAPLPEHRAFVLDTLGEMGSAYRAADVAFIGGSLVPLGGHNAAETAPFACAAVIGPDVSRNAATVAEMVEAGALLHARSAAQTRTQLEALLDDPDRRARQAAAAAELARSWGARRRSCAERLLTLVAAPDA